MNPLLGIQEGIREIWSHKFRSLLTGLGVILGVSSLMAMFALTNGQAIQFRETMETWGGAERVHIEDAPVPEEQESMRDQSPGRTYADVVALRRAPFVKLVSPEQRLTKGAILEYRGRQFGSRWVRGVEEPFLEIENHRLAHGRFFNEVDARNRSRVLVIGAEVRRRLFGGVPAEEVLSSQVQFNGVTFTVVGIFEEYNARYKDFIVVIPFQTMQELFFSSDVRDGVDRGPIRTINRLSVQVQSMEVFDEALEQMRNILLQTHHGVEDFGFRTRENTFENIEDSIAGVRLSGFIVSGVTLIAAGVGITNIMMASIRERTREIGVRRALGAGQANIFVQICMEALVLAFLGGVLGVVSGFALIYLLEDLLQSFAVPVINAEGVFWSFFASVMIGFLAGIAPAAKAAGMKPIEALRFE